MEFEADRSLQQIERAQYPIILAPFHQDKVAVKLRELNGIQIESCGDISLIETLEDKMRLRQKRKIKEYLKFLETIYKIAKMALISPTLEEILSMIENNGDRPNWKEDLKQAQEKINLLKHGDQRMKLQTEIDYLRIVYEFPLPDNFTNFIIAYSLSIDKTDIKRVSEEQLIEAAILAERGNKSPHEYIDGIFTPFNHKDIDKRAWLLLDEKRKALKRA